MGLRRLQELDEERAAIMVDAGVPRVWWRQALAAARSSTPASSPASSSPPAAAPDPRVFLDPRCAALGKITSSVSPPWNHSGIRGAGQLALPGEPAQLDLEGAPLALLEERRGILEEPPPVDPSQLELELPGRPQQLELDLQRRRRHELANGLRPCARPRVAKCGRVRVVPALEIRMCEGRAHFSGLLTCGSVWECPHCSAKIRASRATEVQQAIAWHGAERTSMLTLTVRHGMGEDLAKLRAGVAGAWRLMQQGAPWRRFRERVELVGTVRALEVTHGPNGWHPHLHLLVLVGDPAQLEREQEWLAIRWRGCVARALGESNLPSLERGCVITPCHASDYIAKLGLELAGGVKDGREGHRTPWQIASDAVGNATDRVLWRSYCDGIFGARMLTWSKGLRAAAGLGAELDDQEVAAAEDPAAARVCFIQGAVWDALRVTPAIIVALLEAAEHGGAQGVQRVIARVLVARRASPAAAPRGPPPS